MGLHSQSGSRRSGQRFQKTPHEKAKRKTSKAKFSGQLDQEMPAFSAQQVLDKTVERLGKLGTQTFAISPFSQYFDDWLVNVRQTIAEFETNPAINADEIFSKERAQVFSDVEGELAKKKIEEADLNAAQNTLAETNHLLVETDVAYATQTKEIAAKRNSEIERLTKTIHELEEDLDRTQKTKTSFINPLAKKVKAQNVAALNQKLTAAKSKLEVAVKNFAAEQEKLHDNYEKKKQEAMKKVQMLENQVSDIETDTSVPVRQAACEALIKAARAMLQRANSP